MGEKISPEVLIYLQNVKKLFITNDETRKYFGVDNVDSSFLDYVSEISQKNFEENGTPELTVEQFESIRKKTGRMLDFVGMFMFLGDYGMISLN